MLNCRIAIPLNLSTREKAANKSHDRFTILMHGLHLLQPSRYYYWTSLAIKCRILSISILGILKESSPRRGGFVAEKTLKQCISALTGVMRLCCGVI